MKKTLITHDKRASSDKDYDIVVIGAGSAGFAAVRTALGLNKKIAVIEQGPFGGLCILRGCMPSKTLLRTAQIAKDIKDGPTFGVIAEKVTIRPDIYIERKNRLIKEFADYRNKSLKEMDVDIIEGRARYLDGNTIKVGDRVILAKKSIISTGSSEFIPPIAGLSDVDYLISDDVFDLKIIPKSIIILGGGAIALEMASYFNAIGAEVTLIQRSTHILSKEDEDVAVSLQEAMREEGVAIYTNTQMKALKSTGNGIEVEFTHKTASEEENVKIYAEKLLLALGRVPNLESLNLKAAGISFNNGRLIVNDYLQTTNPDIFIAGDALSIMQVGNVAIAQGEVAVHNAFHKKKKTIDYWRFPIAIFSTPEFATVGTSQKELDKANIEYDVATYPFDDEGKAIVIGKTHGLLKIIYGKKDRKIVGIAVVGEHASELIHEGAVLLHFNATVDDLAKIPHVHPTLTEIYSYLADEID